MKLYNVNNKSYAYEPFLIHIQRLLLRRISGFRVLGRSSLKRKSARDVLHAVECETDGYTS
jgi:hypothetical protein